MKKSFLFVIILLCNNLFLNAQAINNSKKELNSKKHKSFENNKHSSNNSSSVDSENVGFL